VVESGGARYKLDPNDDVVARELFLQGAFSDSMQKILGELERRPEIPFSLEDRVLLDIGANIGTTTIGLLTRFPSASAVVFEPAPRNFQLLRENIAENSMSDRVRPVQVALSDSDAEVRLELSDSNSGDHRVRMSGGEDTGDLYGEDAREVIEVPARRFDTLVTDRVIDLDQVGLVWMDAQGHEGHILSAAETLLRSPVPVVMEYWPYGLRRAGGIEMVHELVGRHYSYVVDLGPPYADLEPAAHPAGALAELEERYYESEATYTDLILVS
jgi:FkbM family methyltransferase